MILGLFGANYAMLFFLIGFLLGVPLLAWALNLLTETFTQSWADNPFRRSTASDVCTLVDSFTTLTNQRGATKSDIILFASIPTAMVSFFLGYILTNAIQMYKREPDANADPTKVSNRKTNAMISLVCVAVFSLVALYVRYSGSCEHPVALVSAAALFGGMGYLWYSTLSSFGQGRMADIFGVANRILPSPATVNGPMACFAS